MYMILFAKTYDCSIRGMFLMNAVYMQNDFRHTLCIISSHSQQTCCLYAIIRTLSEMEATLHWIILSTVYCWNWYLETHSSYVKTLTTTAGSWYVPDCTDPIKNKKYSIVVFSKPAMETTQFLIQWVYGFFPRSKVARVWSWPKKTI